MAISQEFVVYNVLVPRRYSVTDNATVVQHDALALVDWSYIECRARVISPSISLPLHSGRAAPL